MNNSILVNIATQQLLVFNAKKEAIKQYTVATAKNGFGEMSGSECTPRGKHIIRAKIGDQQPVNSVFIGRRPTGEIFNPDLKKEHPLRDWILTRILWLSGTERNKNRLGKLDTMRRYIYIHGCPDEDRMGVPSSHGCIKMRNNEMIELFDLISVFTPVEIIEG